MSSTETIKTQSDDLNLYVKIQKILEQDEKILLELVEYFKNVIYEMSKLRNTDNDLMAFFTKFCEPELGHSEYCLYGFMLNTLKMSNSRDECIKEIEDKILLRLENVWDDLEGLKEEVKSAINQKKKRKYVVGVSSAFDMFKRFSIKQDDSNTIIFNENRFNNFQDTTEATIIDVLKQYTYIQLKFNCFSLNLHSNSYKCLLKTKSLNFNNTTKIQLQPRTSSQQLIKNGDNSCSQLKYMSKTQSTQQVYSTTNFSEQTDSKQSLNGISSAFGLSTMSDSKINIRKIGYKFLNKNDDSYSERSSDSSTYS